MKSRKELERLSVDELINLVLELQTTTTPTPMPASSSESPSASRPSNGEPDKPGDSLEGITLSADAAAAPQVPHEKALDLNKQLQQASLLLQLSIEFRETLESAVIIERMLQVIAKNLGISNASVVMIGLNGSVELAISLSNGKMQRVTSMVNRSVLNRGLAGWALRHGRSVVLPDVSRDKRWTPYAEWQRTGSAIVLPIRQSQTTLGVLTVFHPSPNHFASHDMLLMEGVAAQAGVALGSSRRYQEESLRREQALTLLAMSQYLTTERSYEDLATMLQEKSVSVFGVDYGLLFLPAGNARLAPVAVPLSLTQPSNKSLLRQATLSAWSAWEKKDIVTETDSPDIPSRAFVAVPLIHRGIASGVVVLIRTSKDQVAFPASLWSLLTTFTNVVAATCANMDLVDQLRRTTGTLEAEVEERTRQVKQSRDFLRLIFDNLSEGLVLLDPQEVIVEANNLFSLAIVGRHPEEMVGESLPDVWEELEERGELRIEVQHSGHAGRSEGRTMRVFCTAASGHPHWYEVTRTAVTGHHDEIEYYIERWVDVTEQERLQRQLLLQDQQNILGHLAARFVHDINPPFQHVTTAIKESLQDYGLSDTIRHRLEQSSEELHHVGHVLESLNHLYQSPRTVWECVNISDVLQKVKQFTAQHLEKHTITLELDIEEIPLIYAQPDALRQVFMGIIFNAQEAMPLGGTITITARWLADPPGGVSPHCNITIRDSGMGMTSDQSAQVFEPFRSSKPRGIGLGLYLSKQIIEQHEGRIELSSAPDEGTAVEVCLPRHKQCDNS